MPAWPEAQLLHEVRLYAESCRDYESAQAALSVLFRQEPALTQTLPESLATIIRRRVLNRESWNSVTRAEKLAGRRECEAKIREAIRLMLNTKGRKPV